MHRLLLLACVVACGAPKPAEEPVAGDIATAPAPRPAPPAVDLPEIRGSGFDRVDPATAQVASTPTSLLVKGMNVVALVDGSVAAADLVGDGPTAIIPRLREHTSDFGTVGVLMRLDRTTPYRTLLQIMSTLQTGGLLSVSVAARAGTQTVSAPIALPPPRTTAWVRHTVPPDFRPSADVQPAIALTRGELRLFSISGTAGTLAKPALVIQANPALDLAPLAKTLAALRAKHGAPTDQAMIVAADDTVPLQTLLEVIAVVRATPEGAPLYPDVVLATSVSP